MAKVLARILTALLLLAVASVCMDLQRAEEYALKLFGMLLLGVAALGTIWFWLFLED